MLRCPKEGFQHSCGAIRSPDEQVSTIVRQHEIQERAQRYYTTRFLLTEQRQYFVLRNQIHILKALQSVAYRFIAKVVLCCLEFAYREGSHHRGKSPSITGCSAKEPSSIKLRFTVFFASHDPVVIESDVFRIQGLHRGVTYIYLLQREDQATSLVE